jgi:hypothetical protein
MKVVRMPRLTFARGVGRFLKPGNRVSQIRPTLPEAGRTSRSRSSSFAPLKPELQAVRSQMATKNAAKSELSLGRRPQVTGPRSILDIRAGGFAR